MQINTSKDTLIAKLSEFSDRLLYGSATAESAGYTSLLLFSGAPFGGETGFFQGAAALNNKNSNFIPLFWNQFVLTLY